MMIPTGFDRLADMAATKTNVKYLFTSDEALNEIRDWRVIENHEKSWLWEESVMTRLYPHRADQCRLFSLTIVTNVTVGIMGGVRVVPRELCRSSQCWMIHMCKWSNAARQNNEMQAAMLRRNSPAAFNCSTPACPETRCCILQHEHTRGVVLKWVSGWTLMLKPK